MSDYREALPDARELGVIVTFCVAVCAVLCVPVAIISGWPIAWRVYVVVVPFSVAGIVAAGVINMKVGRRD